MLSGLLMVLLLLTSVFLILLVLVQRGRGGGLAGAFGGLGGQSAFGTKAGDLFTRITVFTAALWIILCAFSVKYFNEGGRSVLAPDLGKARNDLDVTPGSRAGDAKGGSAKGSDAKGGDASKAAPAKGAAEAPAGDARGAATAPSAPAAAAPPTAGDSGAEKAPGDK